MTFDSEKLLDETGQKILHELQKNAKQKLLNIPLFSVVLSLLFPRG